MEQTSEKSSVQYEQLSLQQRHILNIVKDHIRLPKVQREQQKLAVLVTGTAGSGKSTLLRLVKVELERRRLTDYTFNYIVASFTGVSSRHIDGLTLHSSFGLPLTLPRTDEDLTRFIIKWRSSPACSRLRKVSFIVIDECSFISQDLWVLIEKLLRVAKPAKHNIPFAGTPLLVGGDFHQILPFDSRPLFYPADDHQAYKLYKYLSTCFVLEHSFRQSGQSQDQVQYREFLARLRHKKCKIEDVDLIRTRRSIVLSESEKETFKDALRIFPYRAEVQEYNAKALREQFQGSILTINSFGKRLELAVGCRVIFTRNVRSLRHYGITNSTVGIVKGIALKEGQQPIGFCDIRNVIDVLVQVKIGPITTRVSVIPDSGPDISLPLALGYSLTIHKCQGVELPKVVARLGRDEFTTNCDYTIFSRVKCLKDIMIIDPFINDERLIRRVRKLEGYIGYECKRLKRLQHSCYRDGSVVKYLNKRSLGFQMRRNARRQVQIP